MTDQYSQTGAQQGCEMKYNLVVLLADDVNSGFDFISVLVEGVHHHDRRLHRVLLEPLRDVTQGKSRCIVGL